VTTCPVGKAAKQPRQVDLSPAVDELPGALVAQDEADASPVC
jgi:hypothetical protein